MKKKDIENYILDHQRTLSAGIYSAAFAIALIYMVEYLVLSWSGAIDPGQGKFYLLKIFIPFGISCIFLYELKRILIKRLGKKAVKDYPFKKK